MSLCINDSGKVIGTFYYIAGKDIESCYREIYDGKWLDDSPYGVMQGMLKKLGFKHCGTVFVEEDDDPRLAFEKIGE